MDELIKISDLSNQYGVSTRTLRYYEEIGLIQSQRTDEYAYRMYDEHSKNRLEQILILRKLNISIKDIQYIFSTDSSKAVLDVLMKKAQNIDDEISLLHELKRVVITFIRQIEKSDFNKQEDVNQLFKKANEIEKVFMDSDYEGVSTQTLDFDNIAMRTRKMINVRVIDLPTRKIAIYKDYEKLPDSLKRFNDSFYPSKFRRFNAFIRDFERFVVLPDKYPTDPSFKTDEFKGGLYAVGIMNNQPPVTEMYFPIAQAGKHKPAVAQNNADNILSNVKVKCSKKINLNTLICKEPTVTFMKDGERIVYDHRHDGYLHTKEKFTFPSW